MSRPLTSVYLIGAGPGDPGLLTLRGRDCLARADLVIYDYLVDPQILRHAKLDAEVFCLGRHGHGRILSQEEINRRLVDAARAGRVVARLKGGDPTLFGRLSDEIAALEAADIAYEVVPGVTAASAASACTGLPLTHRAAASCVAFVTGRESDDKPGAPLDAAGLAAFPGTLVFYMGVTTASDWAPALVAHGMPADTPAAIVRRASLPDQQTIVTTLAELPRLLGAGAIRPPAVVVVGQAIARRATVDWFAARPLIGRTILVTRPEHQADPLADDLAELGARILRQPAIEISPPPSFQLLDAAQNRLAEFDWIVFSSANGVEHFFARLFASGRDARALGNAKLAAIGPATAEALAALHLQADLQPAEYRAEALAAALAPTARGQHFLLVRASRGREVLADALVAAAGHIEQVVAYESRDVVAPDPEVAAQLAAGRIEWITVTSSAIARSLSRLFGETLRKTRLAAISPLTAEVLVAEGFPPAAVAEIYTTTGLVDAILKAESAI